MGEEEVRTTCRIRKARSARSQTACRHDQILHCETPLGPESEEGEQFRSGMELTNESGWKLHLGRRLFNLAKTFALQSVQLGIRQPKNSLF